MLQTIVDCIADQHQTDLLIAALGICVVSVLTTCWMLHRAWSLSDAGGYRVWGLWGAGIFAIGVWATHFVAMLGNVQVTDITFDGSLTLLSAVVAVAGIVAAAFLLGRGGRSVKRAASGLLAAASVTAMHYIGIDALHGAAVVEIDGRYLASSFLVIGLLYAAAFTLLIVPGKPERLKFAVPMLILGVLSLHFGSMAGVTVIPMKGIEPIALPITKAALGQLISFVVILAILGAVAGEGLFSIITRQAAQEQERLLFLTDIAIEGILIVKHGVITQANASICRLLGARRTDLIRRPIDSILKSGMTEANLSCEKQGFCAAQLQGRDGQSIEVEISKRKVDEQRGVEIYAVRDVRHRLEQQKAMHELAYTDACTGAPNRRDFLRELAARLSGPDGQRLVIGILDLDRFKEINDKYGHGAGDKVLKIAAEAIAGATQPGEMVARIAGDEFGLILGPYMNDNDLSETASRIIRELCKSVSFDDVTVDIGASLGLSKNDQLGLPVDELLAQADRALYAAKQGGRGNWRLYDDGLHADHLRKKQIELSLRSALKNGEFELYFQPEVSSRSGQVAGFEALLRWHREGPSVMLPGQFLQIAEDSGLICDIGRWTLMTACRVAATWPGDQFVAVNVSARQIIEMELVSVVRQALASSGLDAARLQIEVTETALFQNSRATKDVLDGLREIGVRVALDDFGTGYSSVSHLHTFPVDVIKIDRMFVKNLSSDRKSLAIVDAVSRLAGHLGIEVVAEGVETREQALLLSKQGCHLLQGFLFGTPKPQSDLGIRAPELMNIVA